MSSTTDRSAAQRGQVLPLLAGGLIAIILIAALVFDVGQNLLDRRTEQNASDAAALAGAQYLTVSTSTAINAARQVAADNGYTDGVNNAVVTIKVPPGPESEFSGLAGYIEVEIGSTRPSILEGVIGTVTQRTGAMGVAANAAPFALPYSLLALDPTSCGKNLISGAPGSAITTNGAVHVDSSCPTAALQLSGNGVLTAPECDVVGTIATINGAKGAQNNQCATAPGGVLRSGDPLRELPPPPEPTAPTRAVEPLDGGLIPAGCPGGNSPGTDAQPAACAFISGQVGSHVYRIYPGDYPGGIQISKGTIYMDPGIYWLGGGGLQVQNTGSLISKASADNSGTTPSGGVLIYNTQDPTISGGCPASGSAGCYGTIILNGSSATLALLPMQFGPYQNMVIFVDRAMSNPPDIQLNGADSFLTMSGTIYAPNAQVQLNGSSTDSVAVQLICYDFQVNGSGASFTMNYDPSKLFHLSGTGLVQ